MANKIPTYILTARDPIGYAPEILNVCAYNISVDEHFKYSSN